MRARVLAVVVGGVAIAGAAAYASLRMNGFSARAEPSAAERAIARVARRWAIPRAARQLPNPVPYSVAIWAEAREHFADHCATCHANDGSGRSQFGQSLYPRAPDMRQAETQALSDGELYWVIENGIRMSGMPAFGSGTDDDVDTWKLVHFVRKLNELTSEQLKEMERLNPKSPGEIEEERADQLFLAGQDEDKENQK